MSAVIEGSSGSPGLVWVADLTFEHDGQVAARLKSDERGCVFEIAGRKGLLALGRLPLKAMLSNSAEGSLARLAGLMPGHICLKLNAVPIGNYEPTAPLNTWSRTLGLPFGRLTIDKLAFARASLSARS